MAKKKPPTVVDPNLPPPAFEQTQKALRRYVENFYDIQEMRLSAGGRVAIKKPKLDVNGKPLPEIKLHEVDLARLERTTTALQAAEDIALKDIEECLHRVPFYKDVLSDKVRYRGIGPTMAGVILSSFDIRKEEAVSQMWSFAGLAPIPAYRCKYCNAVVDCEIDEWDDTQGRKPFNWQGASSGEILHPKIDKIKCSSKGRQLTHAEIYYSGQAMKPKAGVKLNFNKWLRTKLVGVLGPVILKMTSFHCPECDDKMVNLKDTKNGKKVATEDYFHPSKKDPDTGEAVQSDCALAPRKLKKPELVRRDAHFRKFYDDYKHRKESAGWGMNDGHRHNAAIRYMVKMLLADIHTKWRTFEGLPVRVSYQEQYLGHKHHSAHDDHSSHVSQSSTDNHTTHANQSNSVNRHPNDDQSTRVNQLSTENHVWHVDQPSHENHPNDVNPEFLEAVMDEEIALADR